MLLESLYIERYTNTLPNILGTKVFEPSVSGLGLSPMDTFVKITL